MLKGILAGILALMLILGIGCRPTANAPAEGSPAETSPADTFTIESAPIDCPPTDNFTTDNATTDNHNTTHSPKEMDGVDPDVVQVTFKDGADSGQVAALLVGLGSHIVRTRLFFCNYVLVSVPEGWSAPRLAEALRSSPLVSHAQLEYLFDPDVVTVQFTVEATDCRVSDLLEGLGSRISRTYEYSDFVLVSVPEDKTVAEMVEALSASAIVEYAEPNGCGFYLV